MGKDNFLGEGLEEDLKEKRERIKTNIIYVGIAMFSLYAVIYMFVFPFFR